MVFWERAAQRKIDVMCPNETHVYPLIHLSLLSVYEAAVRSDALKHDLIYSRLEWLYCS